MRPFIIKKGFKRKSKRQPYDGDGSPEHQDRPEGGSNEPPEPPSGLQEAEGRLPEQAVSGEHAPPGSLRLQRRPPAGYGSAVHVVRKLLSRFASSHKGQAPAPHASEPLKLDPVYANALRTMKAAFQDCSDVVFREIQVSDGVKGFVVYVDGMVKSEEISDRTLFPLFRFPHRSSQPDVLKETNLLPSQMTECASYEEAADAVLAGNAVLFIQGQAKAVAINARGGTRRGVEEPQSESVIRGPREGFNENLRTNTSLLRFKIKSPDLKMKSFTVGDKTKTAVALSYIEGIADPRIVEEAERRLCSIRIDGILESGYIEELIEDEPLSPFPQMQYTERPDTAAAALLEGRFAIFVDGTPFVLMGPVTFWQFMQASEDYYERYFVGNMIRWLRMVFIGIALFLPALYVAVSTYHQDMLPTNLLLSIAAARESIPFPALVEALMMEISFEALREAGIRLPKTVGQAVSILGALVIGQAAVQAGIVSAPMVIIVSLTGIASFTIPRFNMAISIRLLRFPLMILAGLFGLFGIVVGLVLITVHLCSLQSFGVPYLSGIAPYKKREAQDIMVRVPWWKMIFRPASYSHLNRKRLDPSRLPFRKQPEGSS